jgi:hypothetical protein
MNCFQEEVKEKFISIINMNLDQWDLLKVLNKDFQRIEEEIRQNFDDATIPAGLPEYVEDILNSLQETMQNIPLGDDFGNILD